MNYAINNNNNIQRAHNNHYFRPSPYLIILPQSSPHIPLGVCCVHNRQRIRQQLIHLTCS